MAKSKILLHLGAPSPDFDQLTRSLRKDHEHLAEHNMVVRLPRMYRSAIDEALIAQDLGEYDLRKRTDLVWKLRADKDGQRVYASNDSFLAQHHQIFQGGRLYANAGQASAALRALFPDHDVEFLLTIRNPVNMVADMMPPDLEGDYSSFTQGMALDQIFWADVAADITASNPDCELTLWPQEDHPMIWPSLLRHVTGSADMSPRVGDLDACASLMGDMPKMRLASFLANQRNMTESKRSAIIHAFLERFHDPDIAEQEIDLNGVGIDTIDCVSTAYEDDIDRCKTLERVRVISWA